MFHFFFTGSVKRGWHNIGPDHDHSVNVQTCLFFDLQALDSGCDVEECWNFIMYGIWELVKLWILDVSWRLRKRERLIKKETLKNTDSHDTETWKVNEREKRRQTDTITGLKLSTHMQQWNQFLYIVVRKDIVAMDLVETFDYHKESMWT